MEMRMRMGMRTRTGMGMRIGMRMRKIIGIFSALLLMLNVFAQKDGDIDLQNDISGSNLNTITFKC